MFNIEVQHNAERGLCTVLSQVSIEIKARDGHKTTLRNSKYVYNSTRNCNGIKVLVEEHLQRFGKVRWALLAKSFRGISPRDLLNKWNFMMEQNVTR